MRFLLDVHIASSIERALKAQGHEVVNAAHSHANWTDEQLLDLAVRDGRVLVTEDRDFSELVYRDNLPPPPAILYLRSGPADQAEMTERLLFVIANARVKGHMIVIQRASVRYRLLREKSNNA